MIDHDNEKNDECIDLIWRHRDIERYIVQINFLWDSLLYLHSNLWMSESLRRMIPWTASVK